MPPNSEPEIVPQRYWLNQPQARSIFEGCMGRSLKKVTSFDRCLARRGPN